MVFNRRRQWFVEPQFFPIYFGLKPDFDAWIHFAAVKYKWKNLSNVKAINVCFSWTTWYRSYKIPWLKLPFVLEKMATAWQLFLWSQLVFSKSLWVDLPLLSTFAAKFWCHYRVNKKQTNTHTHTHPPPCYLWLACIEIAENLLS